MADISLVFDQTAYAVPRKSIFELLNHDRSLLDAATYAVQSSVPREVFTVFLDSLKTQTKIAVTNANAVPLALLAKEFCLSELISDCATFSVSVDHFLRLSERVSRLESQIATFSSPSHQFEEESPPRQFEEEIESQEERLESLRSEFDRLKLQTASGRSFPSDLDNLRSEVDKLKLQIESARPSASDLDSLRLELDTLKSAHPASDLEDRTPELDALKTAVQDLQQSFQKCVLNFRLTQPNPSGGVIAYLTKKHGGNVHEKGIVTIHSKSFRHDPGLCTSAIYGRKYISQLAFHCRTCGLVGNLGCCDVCARICHRGHDVVADGTLDAFYCDCGEGKSGQCQCLMPIADAPDYPPKHLAYDVNCTPDQHYHSRNESGQWVCWDFRQMSVRLTTYRIIAAWLKSWIVEGSVDGESWTEIDRKKNTQEFKDLKLLGTGSFVVAKPMECRFIRLTQTATNHNGSDILYLRDVEFFGTLAQ
jgi:hypothetical protein